MDACLHMGTPPWSETDCYGSNGYGQLAQNPAQWPSTLGIILGTGLGNSTTGVSVADNYMCAIQSSGVIQCSGRGTLGELGNGQAGIFWQPQTVGNGQRFWSVTTGGRRLWKSWIRRHDVRGSRGIVSEGATSL